MAMKKNSTKSYSADELRKLRSHTDWSRVDATSSREIEAQVAEDPDDWITTADATVMRGIPPRSTKERVNIRIDSEVLDFFRASGPGYQTRINEVLKIFVRRSREPAGKRRAGRR
jgi:uncharacterized protein (DUF4415 family)